MQLMQLGPSGCERPARLTAGGAVHDLTTVTTDITGALPSADGVSRARAAVEGGELLSQCTTVERGDVVDPGTSEDVTASGRLPYPHAGDVVEFEIDRLGRQRQVWAAGAKEQAA